MKTITSSRYINLPVVLVLFFVCALVLASTVSSKAPKKISAGKDRETIRMFDIGVGARTYSFHLGSDTATGYLGAGSLQQAMQAEQLQPRTMVSDDFNGDGMGDLVIGYENGGAGVLGMRHGNLQAISPTDPSIFQAITQGRYPSPFLPEVKLYSLPEAPDFLQFGDFNSDGYADVMAAARGGQRMYLLAGDGRGNLGDAQAIEVPGLLTEMQAAPQQLGTFTQLALGISAPGGAQLAVYKETKALAGGPESYSMSGEVTSIAFDQLDGDGITDLAAATSNEVVIVHGRGLQPIDTANTDAKSPWESATAAAGLIERENVPFTIRGLATGDFTFDRNHQREIGLLSDEGSIYLLAQGIPDTRPFTKAEKKTIGDLRRSFAREKIDSETLKAEINKMIRPNRAAGWNVAQTMKGTSAYTGTGKTVFQRSNAFSGLDELLVGDGINNRVQVVRNELDEAKRKIQTTPQSSDSKEVSVAGAPMAAVSMRLSVGVKPGTVVLGSKQVEPTVVILAPHSFTVNSTADLPDTVPTAANNVCQASNGLCTLRAAIMQSNHSGGENTIMVPDGTYTLTLGPPDDEFNTGGATEQSGDLDIFSWDLFDGSPILNSVSITGGTRDGCIIQMGTLSPTLATNVPNNKERILEVNDVAVIGFQNRIAVTLTNLTMQNGFSPTGSGNFLEGGAIYFDGSASDNTNIGLLTLTNVKLSGNTSAGQGGGVWAGFGSLTINSTSIVRANTATNQSTGGVAWTGGNTVETQALIISGSTIGGALVADGNQATDPTFGAPGGVDARGGLSVTISNSTIQNNIANVTVGTIGGGGIQINSPTVAISNTTISNNTSKSNAGGIFSSARNAVTNASSTITLTSVNVTGNQADSDNSGAGDGGGIFNFFGAMTIQTSSHIDGNSAVNGGGIFAGWTGIASDPTAGLTVNTNSTIGQAGAGNGNSARNNGGSIAINPVGATLFNPINLTNLTFTNNTANSDSVGGGDGGAIFVGAGQLTSLNTCTIDGNVANLGTGDGIRQTGGTITGAGTINVNGADTISLTGGTFTSTPGSLNLTGNLLNSGGNFVHNSGTVVFNGSAAQSIGGTTAMTFNNLTINNASGVSTNTASTAATGTLTLTLGALAPNAASTFTVNGPVAFTNGTFNANATSTVNYNKASNTQNIAPGNYGNLTFSNFTKQLPAATIRIAGVFTTGATGGHTVTGNTVEFNGTSAQTLPGTFTPYNNLTLNNAAGTTGFSGLTVTGLIRVMAGTFTSSSTYNDVQIDLGATLAGVVTTTINVSGNWTNNGTFIPNNNTVNFNGAAGQVLSGTPTSQSFGGFTVNKSAGVLSTSGGTTSLDINGALTITAGSFTAPAAITLAGAFNQDSGTTFTPGSGLVTFDGGGAQSIAGTLGTKTFFNFAVNKGGGSTLSGVASTTALDINGNVTLTLGTFAAGTAAAMTVAGNWTNNGGTFTPGSGTVTFDGGAGQTIGGTTATTFNNLTNGNASGLAMASNNNVNGVLALTSSDITVAAGMTLTQTPTPASTGAFDVVGNVRRSNAPNPLPTTALTFGNPFNSITFSAGGTLPTDVTVNLVKAVPSGGIAFPTAVQRTYTITPTGGTGYSATLRLHYLDAELNGNVEADLGLWRFGTAWARQGKTASDSVTNNWVELSGVTQFSPWTLSSAKNDSTTLITSDNPDPSGIGQAVMVNWNVTSNVGGAPALTGNVTITVDDASGDTCTAAVGAGGCSLTLTTVGSKTLTATYVGDANFNGGADTEPHGVVQANVSARDARAPEPTSGTSTMLFTIALSTPASGPSSVNFATADGGATPATAGTCGSGGDYVATSGTANFTAGQQLQTVAVTICSDASVEPDETFLLNLTVPVNLNITDGQAVGTITAANTPGTVLISELRTSGPAGATDEFVEIYNNSDSPLNIQAVDASPGAGLFKMGAACGDTPVLIGTIPNGTIIPARGHYLFVGSAYSLSNYGGTGAAAANAPLTTDIEADRNVALFHTTDVANLSSETRRDAVGFGTNTGGNCDLLREGTNLQPAGGSTAQHSFVRKMTTGLPQDTNDNAADFAIVSTDPTVPIGSNPTPILGAPGPENQASPIQRNSTIKASLIDPAAASTASPNRVRDINSYLDALTPSSPSGAGGNYTLGTLLIRRKFTNNTGASVTRLRFRIVDITSTNAPPGGVGQADVRSLSSATQASVTITGGGTVAVQGLTLEQPPTQTRGGGLNSSLAAGTITLATPLAPGANINVNFLLGVATGGSYRFFINVEALP